MKDLAGVCARPKPKQTGIITTPNHQAQTLDDHGACRKVGAGRRLQIVDRLDDRLAAGEQPAGLVEPKLQLGEDQRALLTTQD